MHDASGVGLAATQVGVLQRLFVVEPADEEPRALVNPRIVERSAETAVDDEGCLSLQGVLVPVERNVKVTVEALDVHGAPLRLEFEELGARVVQHELDHLDGTLIIDRTDPESRRGALATLRPKPVLYLVPLQDASARDHAARCGVLGARSFGYGAPCVLASLGARDPDSGNITEEALVRSPSRRRPRSARTCSSGWRRATRSPPS